MPDPHQAPHVLLLLTSRTYRAEAFIQAARQLDVDLTVGVEAGSVSSVSPGQVELDFTDLDQGVTAIRLLSQSKALNAILAAEDEGALLAANAAASLGLTHSSLDAVLSSRDKLRMRQRLADGPFPAPPYWNVPLDTDPEDVAEQIMYPCVVKPRFLSGSRGVIRADDPAQFVQAFRRTSLILRHSEVQSQGGDLARSILVEGYIPGQEVAVEGLIHQGEFHLLAIFDKPDPLIGPTFEETLYVTPSRHSPAIQDQLVEACRSLIERLGLSQGPLHAEFRINQDGVWPIDVAPRSIGGLCSRALRFGEESTIEELILRQALGWDLGRLARESAASGVMMIPTPSQGVLEDISGVEEAKLIHGVEEVIIDIRPGQPLLMLPEATRYLGFIFARLPTPQAVEAALREAHRQLRFEISR